MTLVDIETSQTLYQTYNKSQIQGAYSPPLSSSCGGLRWALWAPCWGTLGPPDLAWSSLNPSPSLPQPQLQSQHTPIFVFIFLPPPPPHTFFLPPPHMFFPHTHIFFDPTTPPQPYHLKHLNKTIL